MKNKTLEPKTDPQPSPSPYQAERSEAQQTPGLRSGPLGVTLAPPGSEATLGAHAAGLNRATAGPALRFLQRQVGNRYVQRLMEWVQRRGSGEGFTLDDETAGRINRARGGGQPLDSAMQAQMSEALGHDFSGVRVHTDPEAHTLNRLLSARAFTTGQDIFFRRGEYNPGSGRGRELIAHELTHVVQQGTGRVPGAEGLGGVAVRPAGDALENAADAQALKVASAGYEARSQSVGSRWQGKTHSLADSMKGCTLPEGVELAHTGEQRTSTSIAQRTFADRAKELGWAPYISQLVMRHGITPDWTPNMLFHFVLERTADAVYMESQDDLQTGLENHIWNCVSLTRLLVVLYAYTQDADVYRVRNVQERRIHTRKLSLPSVEANIRHLQPNVVCDDDPEALGEAHRFTFAAHTYVRIAGTDFDPLMGTSGATVAATFPHDVARERCTIDGSNYRLQPTGRRVGPLPEFVLEPVAAQGQE